MACSRTIYLLLAEGLGQLTVGTEYLSSWLAPSSDESDDADESERKDYSGINPEYSEPLRSEEGGLTLLEERPWDETLDEKSNTDSQLKSSAHQAPNTAINDTEAVEIELLSATEESAVVKSLNNNGYIPEHLRKDFQLR